MDRLQPEEILAIQQDAIPRGAAGETARPSVTIP